MPGPWRWTDVDYGPGLESYEELKDGPFSALWSDGANKPVMVAQDESSYRAFFDTPHDVDASLILAMVNALPDLIAVVEALREVNDYLGEGCPISQIISRFADDFVASGSQDGLVEKGEALQAALAKLEVEV